MSILLCVEVAIEDAIYRGFPPWLFVEVTAKDFIRQSFLFFIEIAAENLVH